MRVLNNSLKLINNTEKKEVSRNKFIFTQFFFLFKILSIFVLYFYVFVLESLCILLDSF